MFFLRLVLFRDGSVLHYGYVQQRASHTSAEYHHAGCVDSVGAYHAEIDTAGKNEKNWFRYNCKDKTCNLQ